MEYDYDTETDSENEHNNEYINQMVFKKFLKTTFIEQDLAFICSEYFNDPLKPRYAYTHENSPIDISVWKCNVVKIMIKLAQETYFRIYKMNVKSGLETHKYYGSNILELLDVHNIIITFSINKDKSSTFVFENKYFAIMKRCIKEKIPEHYDIVYHNKRNVTSTLTFNNNQIWKHMPAKCIKNCYVKSFLHLNNKNKPNIILSYNLFKELITITYNEDNINIILKI